MNEFIHVMTLPFLACLVLTGIHSYLGFHIIERQVIFVDLALAQIAALGASVAIIFGHDFDSVAAYWLSLGFTMVGALVFSLSRFKRERIPQEAMIGITYAVSAALLILVLSRSGEGDEHIKQALTGNILLVSQREIFKMAVVYSVVGAVHFWFRRPFFLISRDPRRAFEQGLNVRGWDFLFYVLFGVVVTSSVKIAGVFAGFFVPCGAAGLRHAVGRTSGGPAALGLGDRGTGQCGGNGSFVLLRFSDGSECSLRVWGDFGDGECYQEILQFSELAGEGIAVWRSEV